MPDSEGDEGVMALEEILLRKDLVRIRGQALRRRVWFRALSRAERAVVDLAITVVKDRIKSLRLAQIATGIVAKVKQSMASQFLRMVRTVGRPLARKISQIAQAWGNPAAPRWAEDHGFIRFLTIMNLNQSTSG